MGIAELRPGQKIGEYILEERVGQGTFGEVWRAKHHIFNERAAVKIPTDPEYIKNLQQEGVIQHDIVSDHIVHTRGLDPWHDPPYMIMEYVEGQSLRDLLKERKPLGVAAAVNCTRQILEALQAAHAAGVIHRDLKPENVLISSDGTVKVTDFGLGRVQEVTTTSIVMSGSLQSQDGKSVSGTLEYMSPEQRTGQAVDGLTDLYALGVIFFEMLTGDRPSGSEVPSEVNSEVPKALDEFFRRCYARKEKRYASATEALAALETAVAQPQGVPGAGPAGRSTSPGEPVVQLGPMNCANCKVPVGASDFFCSHCGTQLREDLKRCPHCGGFPQEGDAYCIFCGRQVATA